MMIAYPTFSIRTLLITLFGRILVATREIHPGELIFAERPLVVGPAGKFKDVCLVCLKRVQ